MKTIAERLKYARKTSKERCGRDYAYTQDHLGQAMGRTQSTISQMENGQLLSEDFGVQSLMGAAKLLQVSFVWLATGEGDIDSDDTVLLPTLRLREGIPLFSPANAATRNKSDIVQKVAVTKHQAASLSEHAFYTIVTDSGASTVAAYGDSVLIDPVIPKRAADWVLVQLQGYQYPVMRKIVEREEGVYFFCSDNPDLPAIKMTTSSDVLGVAVEFRRAVDNRFKLMEWSETNHRTLDNVISM